MELKLKAANIFKTYNGTLALNDCSYAFDSGGIYALMGPNGSGKSTFLRICALLESPDKGEVIYSSHGQPLKNDLNLRRRITLVLPGVGVFNTTVFKNAAYGLAVRTMSRKDKFEKVETVLELAGLAHKKTHNALTLSSGEAQRLGIARAMAIEPEVIFLDEPTASVDYKNTGIIEDIIMKMKNNGKTTVVIATHDKSQAERLAENILIMQDGRIT